MNQRMYDVIIIGAGIVGLCTAFYSAKAGLRVALLDRSTPGSGTTSKAAGMLGIQAEFRSPNPLYHLAKESIALYKILTDELLEYQTTSLGWTSSGAIKLAFTHSEHNQLSDIQSWQVQHGDPAELLDQQSLQLLAPAVNKEACAGLYFPNEAHVQPKQVARAFEHSLYELGVDVFPYTTATSVSTNRVTTRTDTLYGEQIVIATGHESFANIPWPVTPVKGEIIKVRPRRQLSKQTIFYNGWYAVPKQDGEWLLGATSTQSEDTTISVNGVLELLTNIQAFLPDLRDSEITAMWSGIRPKSIVDSPFISPHPTLHSVWLVSGHNRNGILLGPITGKRVTERLLGNEVNDAFTSIKVGEHSEHHHQSEKSQFT
ncbi:glycine oxidase ThiO [Geomicrobium sediminis]|uniref:glycine oxidase n=1 Tax=Geomicrobium sediminis TaxID=1347788 RepID=A0ABS2PCQ0_9BACL|nr:glycine oxidase ThiO [Geomicrobium sediminis]MBM7633217.1 glycine oxidase [Geomicrobium sediminis]